MLLFAIFQFGCPGCLDALNCYGCDYLKSRCYVRLESQR